MDLIEQLRRDEGVRLHPYTDTVGKLTIGVGRNLADMGISDAEATVLLQNDIDRTTVELNKNFA
jgi:lysozyme